MTSPRLRLRTDDDLDTCVRMLSAVHERHGYPVNWPDDPVGWLRGTAEVAWVAMLHGTCVGHVAIAVEAGSAFVERLFVDPDHSGSGIGRALLRHAATEGRRMAGDVVLDVVAADDAANGLYRSEGWAEVSRTPIAWGPTPASTLIRLQSS